MKTKTYPLAIVFENGKIWYLSTENYSSYNISCKIDLRRFRSKSIVWSLAILMIHVWVSRAWQEYYVLCVVGGNLWLRLQNPSRLQDAVARWTTTTTTITTRSNPDISPKWYQSFTILCFEKPLKLLRMFVSSVPPNISINLLRRKRAIQPVCRKK